MSQDEVTPVDDLVLVDRGQLTTLLLWAGHQRCDVGVTNAQVQLGAELMAAEPPDHWFDDEPGEYEPSDEPADDDDDDEDVPPESRHRAAAVTVLACSTLFLIGLAVAWIVLVVTGP